MIISKDFNISTEQTKATLAKNLVIAREGANLTQDGLAQVSGLSRSTIAQLEAGEADARLSTIVALAQALEIQPPLLLFGQKEWEALSTLIVEGERREIDKQILSIGKKFSEEEGEKLEQMRQSGVPKKQAAAYEKVTEVAVAASKSAKKAPEESSKSTGIGAALGFATLGIVGVAIGTLVGGLLSPSSKEQKTRTRNQGTLIKERSL